MLKHSCALWLLGAFSLCLPNAQAQNIGNLGKDDQRASGALRYKGKGITDIEWTAVRTKDGDSETVTRILNSLAGNNKRSLVQEEETTTRIDSDTTKVTRTTSNFDSRGHLRLTDVVEEERRTLPDGEEHTKKSVATPDSSGRLSVYRQEIQTKVPAGDGVTKTDTSVYLIANRGEFKETERIARVESEQENTIEVEETVHAVDANGRWNAREKRTLTISQSDGKPEREDERIYRQNSKGRLALSKQVISTYELDSQGDQRWTVETHSDTIAGTRRTRDGELELDRRVTITSRTLPGDLEQTIEEVEQRSPANPRSGLQVVERTVTTSRPLRNGERELEVEVQHRDGSGRFKTSITQRTTISE